MNEGILSRLRPSILSFSIALVVTAGTLFLHDAMAQTKAKHGGNIVFEVKRNRQKLPHVLFSHKAHVDAGHDCKDCHNDKVFDRDRELGVNKFSMKDIMKGEACGACHDGKTQVKGRAIFAPKKNCERCHNMKWRKR